MAVPVSAVGTSSRCARLGPAAQDGQHHAERRVGGGRGGQLGQALVVGGTCRASAGSRGWRPRRPRRRRPGRRGGGRPSTSRAGAGRPGPARRPGTASPRRWDPGHLPHQATSGPVGVEQPAQQVGCGHGSAVGLGEAAAAVWPVADDAVHAQQPLHALAVHAPAAAAQLRVHPRRAIGAVRVGVDGAELGDQAGLPVMVGVRHADSPGVVPGVLAHPVAQRGVVDAKVAGRCGRSGRPVVRTSATASRLDSVLLPVAGRPIRLLAVEDRSTGER
jgi:hypothetical protein